MKRGNSFCAISLFFKLTKVTKSGILSEKVTNMDIQEKLRKVRTMSYDIKEIRELTGLTQKEFAESKGIPLSTLRKWEQGESRPAEYVIKMLAAATPGIHNTFRKIKGSKGQCFYYDENNSTVLDATGNAIRIKESLEGVKENNLVIYLEQLFDDFYAIQERFNQDCRFDKAEDIIWS